MIQKIIEMIREINPYEQIAQDTRLVESGILDSMSIFSLVTRLEEEFKIEIADDAITAENFATGLHIAELVMKSKKI